MRFVNNELYDKLLFVLALKGHIDGMHQRHVVSYDVIIVDSTSSLTILLTRQLVFNVEDGLLQLFRSNLRLVHLHDLPCRLLQILVGLGDAIAAEELSSEGKLSLKH